MERPKVLFLCTGNSARSQMAEGFLRHLAGDKFDAYSAGINPTEVNPSAIKVMDEIGVDISRQRSKSVKEFLDKNFDYVITLCDAEWSKSENDTSASRSYSTKSDFIRDNAKQTCPVFPGKYEKIHWDLHDPAQAKGRKEERFLIFRKVRNKIKENILKFLSLPKDKASLKCPHCGYIQEVIIPENSCLHLYECKSCHKTISPTPGSCCVICAYSDKNCPPFNAEE